MYQRANQMNDDELEALFNSEKYLSRVRELSELVVALYLLDGAVKKALDTGNGYCITWADGSVDTMSYQFVAVGVHTYIEVLSTACPHRIFYTGNEALYIFSHEEYDELAEALIYFLRGVAESRRSGRELAQ